MTHLAAALTDRVIPLVPVRQFVLSLPHRLRYSLAYDHDRCIAVLRIYVRALLSFYRRRACKAGVRNGRSGAVTFIQRFGSAANQNVHFHVIALDGVFVADEAGKLAFHAAEAPSEAEVVQLVGTVQRRVLRHLERRGLLDVDGEDSDPIRQASPALASCWAASHSEQPRGDTELALARQCLERALSDDLGATQVESELHSTGTDTSAVWHGTAADSHGVQLLTGSPNGQPRYVAVLVLPAAGLRTPNQPLMTAVADYFVTMGDTQGLPL